MAIVEGQSLPHHKVFESSSGLLKVDAEVVHDGDVVVQFLERGYTGEPAAFSGFWKVNPAVI